MASIFITGSADGLGNLAAKKLIDLGHDVVLQARNKQRAQDALKNTPGAKDVLVAELSSMEETKLLAYSANDYGTFDAIIHNAGVYRVPDTLTPEGQPLIFAVNTLAPYILTCIMGKPKRLIYLSSGMHLQGKPEITPQHRISYSDTKLHDLILALSVARYWKDVYSNAVDPGWVPTKMGGSGAPDNLEKGFETQVWLATSNEDSACVSGHYFHHKKQTKFLSIAKDVDVQEKLLEDCGRITGVKMKI
jgi:NAD(P)-dependent dehydrogenase (short-subunit alcohol dehydrogenase family)